MDPIDPLLPFIIWALTQVVSWVQTKTPVPDWTREALPLVALFLAIFLRGAYEAASDGELTWNTLARGAATGFAAVFLHASTRPLRNAITAPPEE